MIKSNLLIFAFSFGDWDYLATKACTRWRHQQEPFRPGDCRRGYSVYSKGISVLRSTEYTSYLLDLCSFMFETKHVCVCMCVVCVYTYATRRKKGKGAARLDS